MGMLPQGRGACQRASRSPLHVGGRDERALPGPCARVPRAVCTASVPKAASPSPHATRLPLSLARSILRCASSRGGSIHVSDVYGPKRRGVCQCANPFPITLACETSEPCPLLWFDLSVELGATRDRTCTEDRRT